MRSLSLFPFVTSSEGKLGAVFQTRIRQKIPFHFTRFSHETAIPCSVLLSVLSSAHPPTDTFSRRIVLTSESEVLLHSVQTAWEILKLSLITNMYTSHTHCFRVHRLTPLLPAQTARRLLVTWLNLIRESFRAPNVAAINWLRKERDCCQSWGTGLAGRSIIPSLPGKTITHSGNPAGFQRITIAQHVYERRMRTQFATRCGFWEEQFTHTERQTPVEKNERRGTHVCVSSFSPTIHFHFMAQLFYPS